MDTGTYVLEEIGWHPDLPQRPFLVASPARRGSSTSSGPRASVRPWRPSDPARRPPPHPWKHRQFHVAFDDLKAERGGNVVWVQEMLPRHARC